MAALSLLLTAVDRAHDIAGGLSFSATLAIDDPIVDDEGDLQFHRAKIGNDKVTENTTDTTSVEISKRQLPKESRGKP